MAEMEFSNDVRQFLSRNIRSVEQLEILLHLKASPNQSWSVREIYRAVLTNENSIRQSLEALCNRSLVLAVGSGEYRFAAKEESERVIEKLARLYKDMPTRVLSILYAPFSPDS